MEIDITQFFNDADAFEFSASIAERGENAGRETWNNALREGDKSPLLQTPEQIEALREHVKGFGAWGDEEIAGWSVTECNALFIQFVSGDVREIEALCMTDDGDIDWAKYEEFANAGRIGGSISRGDNGKVYYHLSM